MKSYKACTTGALAVLLLVLIGGCDDAVESFVSDNFSGYTPIPYGIASAGYANGIIGRVPNKATSGGVPIIGLGSKTVITFPKLHCCWVCERTGWQPLGKFSFGSKTKVDSSVLASLKAIKANITLHVDDEIQIKASVSRDDILNPRHLYLKGHCELHGSVCDPEFVTSAIKADSLSYTATVKISGSAGATSPAVDGSVQLDNYSETIVDPALNLIIGYSAQAEECGGPGTIAKLGTMRDAVGTVDQTAEHDVYVKADGPPIHKYPTPVSTPPKVDPPSESPKVIPPPGVKPSEVLPPKPN